jgi:spore coat protein A, manganese oxidase
VSANPGVVTRIRSRFDLPPGVTGPQKYVFHCHILEHEDNDMMRPFEVVPAP